MAWDELPIGDAVVRFDAEATAAIYATIARGEADKCECDGCRNYTALRPTIFPREVVSFLQKFGIDPMKEAEPIGYGDELSRVPWLAIAKTIVLGKTSGKKPVAVGRKTYTYETGFDFVGIVAVEDTIVFPQSGSHAEARLTFKSGVDYPWSAFADCEHTAHVSIMITCPFVVEPRDQNFYTAARTVRRPPE